ncbi:deoxyguanosinetriphosphate triphosphohydrolase [Aquimarina sp. U1-2]|uniref:deoxyguanosinetriphosphate triphosphohydrolase n=1 Tax=Aquimarina sp. U1-2 TaxID=2823141 RepID=UPI001AECB632|nr:deoxyguanosinetriphosphate triphosphohydrolase [Aquimarina sp. U1-2]MBP2833250.1 deoxyguanosinetriphosphate triphosphohydrolase [Aquimarina sp. U1-2]
MNWEQLLSLKRQGDTNKRLRKEQDETRLGFEVDYDRIIFSSAFRSLQDKTQVIPLSKTSFVHTRLTHSLEVSVVGRSLGRAVGKKILEKHPHLSTIHGYRFNDFGAIVAAAALAHDIGNPPFGHSGEKAIGEYFKSGKGVRYKDQLTPKQYQDLTDFEGNANGFKLLTESRQGVEGGLRLSYATLGAFMKYPKESLPKQPTKHIAHKKFGYFQNEKSFFMEVAKEVGLLQRKTKGEFTYSRHPLAFLVEAADDICYTIIDFEDGINLGLIEEGYALEYLIKLVKDTINTSKYNNLVTTADRLSYLRSLAINTLIGEVANIFIDNEDDILSGKFDMALIDESKYQAQINDIAKISIEKIYQSQGVIEKEIAGYEILATLLDRYCVAVDNNSVGNPSNYDKLILKAEGDNFEFTHEDLYTRLISICKYVAGLTDGSALMKFHKIKGLQI